MPVTSTIKVEGKWNRTTALDLSTVTDSASLTQTKSLASGTSSDQADQVWHDQRTVTSGSNDDLDLTALTQTVFGSTLTTNVAEVVAILVVNESTTTGNYLTVGSGAATNPIVAPFGAANTIGVQVGPSSAMLVSSYVDGWAVSGSTKTLRIKNNGASSITYSIAIWGRSA